MKLFASTLLSIVLCMTSIHLFVSGYFGFNVFDQTEPPILDEGFSESIQTWPHFSKTVVILVDGLRSDLVTKHRPDHPMPITTGLLHSGHAVGYPVRAPAPTVTLPRLKAMFTGTLPNFMEIFFNFGDGRVEAPPSTIQSLFEHGRHVAFYGDNTWFRIFPDKFVRSEGVHSFVVTDTEEVDFNVTRALDFELSFLKSSVHHGVRSDGEGVFRGEAETFAGVRGRAQSEPCGEPCGVEPCGEPCGVEPCGEPC
eukprot:Rmarinus@m.16284